MGVKYKIDQDQYEKLVESSVKKERIDEIIGQIIGGTLEFTYDVGKAIFRATGNHKSPWARTMTNMADWFTKDKDEIITRDKLRAFDDANDISLNILDKLKEEGLSNLNIVQDDYNTFKKDIQSNTNDLLKLKEPLPDFDEQYYNKEVYKITINVKNYTGNIVKLGELEYQYYNYKDEDDNRIAGFYYKFSSNLYIFTKYKNDINFGEDVNILKIDDKFIKFRIDADYSQTYDPDNSNYNLRNPQKMYDTVIKPILESDSLIDQTAFKFYNIRKVNTHYLNKINTVYVNFTKSLNELTDEGIPYLNEARDNSWWNKLAPKKYKKPFGKVGASKTNTKTTDNKMLIDTFNTETKGITDKIKFYKAKITTDIGQIKNKLLQVKQRIKDDLTNKKREELTWRSKANRENRSQANFIKRNKPKK